MPGWNRPPYREFVASNEKFPCSTPRLLARGVAAERYVVEHDALFTSRLDQALAHLARNDVPHRKVVDGFRHLLDAKDDFEAVHCELALRARRVLPKTR